MAPHRSVHAFTARFFPHSSVSLRWAVAAFALLAALCWASPAWAADSAVFASGAGTESEPYLIANAGQLAAFRDAVNAGNDYAGEYIALGSDVDLEDAEWTPIGVGTRKSSGIAEGSTPFAGTFDGAGHVISGLKIASTQGADFAIGLFGILDGATVKNLTVTDAEVTVPQSELAGILCGMMANDATASGVSVSGSVSGKAGVGGIAGRMTLSGTIENCENSASVAAADGVGNAGGIVGAAYYTTPTGRMAVTGCRNSGSISGTDCIGGIAGLSAAFVSNCENSGAIAGTSYSVGGIVGEQKNYGAVSGCTNSGAVSTSNAGAYGIGGIVGWARYDGAAPAYAASAPITVTGCANSASVQGGSCAGGIVGTFYNAGTVSGNTNTAASIISSNFAGGIVGNLQNADISSLPSTVPEGILVENNVSTTPLNAITAPLKGLYAYNNTPSDFTVRDNGSAWVAQAGATRYASLAGAFATAPDHSTIKLVSSVSDQPTLSVSDGRELTLDLAGFNLFFATDGGLSLQDGALTVTGQGDVATAEGADGKPEPLATVSGTGSLALKGGSYNQDVAPYVADSYAEFVPADTRTTTPFSVVPASTAKHDARAAVHDGAKTIYYGDADAARTAAAAAPGATVEELNAPSTPSVNEGGEGNPGGGQTGTGDNGQLSGGADANAGGKADGSTAADDQTDDNGTKDSGKDDASKPTAKPSTTSGTHGYHRSSTAYRGVPQTGDAATDALLAVGALVIVSGGAAALARARVKRSRTK